MDSYTLKLKAMFENRLSSLHKKLEKDIIDLEYTKYEYHDIYVAYNLATESTDEEFEEPIITETRLSENATTSKFNELDSNFSSKLFTKSGIRGKTPMKSNNKNSVVSQVVVTNRSTANKDRSKTPAKKEASSNLESGIDDPRHKSTISGGIPINVSKRLEARKMSKGKIVDISIKDEREKSPRTKRSDKSPYPIGRDNKNFSSSKNLKTYDGKDKKEASSVLLTNTLINQQQFTAKKSNEEKGSVAQASPTQPNNEYSRLGTQKIDAKAARMDAGIQRNKKSVNTNANSKKENVSRSLIESQGKKLNKTSGAINSSNINNKSMNSEFDTANRSFNMQAQNQTVNLGSTQEKEQPVITKPKVQKIHKLKKTREIKNNSIEVYTLLCRSNFLKLRKRYHMTIYCNEVYSDKKTFNLLIKERIRDLELKIANYDELYGSHLKNPGNDSYLNSLFMPSKTGKSGLNFIRSDDENTLVTKEQPDEIIDFFKIIYIFLKEPYSHLPKSEIVLNLKNNIFSKLGVDSFKSLILNYMINKISFNEDQYEALNAIYNANPKVLNSSDFLKINRSVSYMTFIIKELFDYFMAKTSDGIPLFKLKEYKQKISNMREVIAYMQKYLKT